MVLGHLNRPTCLFASTCRVEPQAFRLLILAVSLLRLLLYLEFSSQLQIPGVPGPALPSPPDALSRFPSSRGKLPQGKWEGAKGRAGSLQASVEQRRAG